MYTAQNIPKYNYIMAYATANNTNSVLYAIKLSKFGHIQLYARLNITKYTTI